MGDRQEELSLSEVEKEFVTNTLLGVVLPILNERFKEIGFLGNTYIFNGCDIKGLLFILDKLSQIERLENDFRFLQKVEGDLLVNIKKGIKKISSINFDELSVSLKKIFDVLFLNIYRRNYRQQENYEENEQIEKYLNSTKRKNLYCEGRSLASNEIPPPLLETFQSYIEAKNGSREIIGDYGAGKPFIYESSPYNQKEPLKIENKTVQEAFKVVAENTRSKQIKAKLKAFADLYKKELYTYHDQYDPKDPKRNEKLQDSINKNSGPKVVAERILKHWIENKLINLPGQ